MFCCKCGNDSDFRTNLTTRTVSCRNPACNHILRTKANFDFKGVDEIAWFAGQMLLKLNMPRHQVQPSWNSTPLGILLSGLQKEVRELESELIRQANDKYSDDKAIVAQACNVANRAMAMADVACITKFKPSERG